MIGISFNKKEFEYDAYTLVKAFYPQEEVENFYEEDAEEKKVYDLLVRITVREDKTHLSLERMENYIRRSGPTFKKAGKKREEKHTRNRSFTEALCRRQALTPSLGESDGHTPYQDRHGAD